MSASRYIHTSDLHRDVAVNTFKTEIKSFATKNKTRLRDHINTEADLLLILLAWNADLNKEVSNIYIFIDLFEINYSLVAITSCNINR